MKRNRHSLDIYFGEPNPQARVALRAALVQEGFHGLRDFTDVTSIHQAVCETAPDLIIIDADMEDSAACRLVRGIRLGKIGNNPFVAVITTTWAPSADLVRRVADCGTDDLLVKPTSPALLMSRVGALANLRKPFVVTADYIGPDRRKDPGRGSE